MPAVKEKTLPSAEQMKATADAVYAGADALERLVQRLPQDEGDYKCESISLEKIGELYETLVEIELYEDMITRYREELRRRLRVLTFERAEQHNQHRSHRGERS